MVRGDRSPQLTAPQPEYTVVVPVHRNRATLAELYRRVASIFDTTVRSPFELLFVDDACPEGSIHELREITRADPRVGTIHLERNVGQNAAVLIGLRHARGAHCVVLDGDLQDPPEAIPVLIREAHASGADAVFAGRRGRYESWSRLATSRLLKLSLNTLVNLPTDAGLYVILSRRLVDRLLEMHAGEPHVLAMIGMTRLRVRSIPVPRSVRPAGHSAYSQVARIRVAWRAFAWVARWKVGLRTPEFQRSTPSAVLEGAALGHPHLGG